MSGETIGNNGLMVSNRNVRGVPGRGKFVFFPGRRKLFSMLTVVRIYPMPFSMITGGRLAGMPFLGRMFTYVGTFVVSHSSIGRSVRMVVGIVGRMGTKEGCLVFTRKAEDGSNGRPRRFGNKDFGTTAGSGYPVMPMTLVSSCGTFSAKSIGGLVIRMRFLRPVCCSRCGSVGAARVTTRMGGHVRTAVARCAS